MPSRARTGRVSHAARMPGAGGSRPSSTRTRCGSYESRIRIRSRIRSRIRIRIRIRGRSRNHSQAMVPAPVHVSRSPGLAYTPT